MFRELLSDTEPIIPQNAEASPAQEQPKPEPEAPSYLPSPSEEGFSPLPAERTPVVSGVPSEEQNWEIDFSRTDSEMHLSFDDNTFGTKVSGMMRKNPYDPSLRLGWAVSYVHRWPAKEGQPEGSPAMVECYGPKDALSLASKCVDDPSLSKLAWPSPESMFHGLGWKGDDPKKQDRVMKGRASADQNTQIVSSQRSFWAMIETTDNTMLTWIRRLCLENPYDAKKNPTGWRMERLDEPEGQLPKGCPSSERIRAFCPKGCVRFRSVRLDIIAKANEIKSRKGRESAKPAEKEDSGSAKGSEGGKAKAHKAKPSPKRAAKPAPKAHPAKKESPKKKAKAKAPSKAKDGKRAKAAPKAKARKAKPSPKRDLHKGKNKKSGKAHRR
jgi:hypothetical protein